METIKPISHNERMTERLSMREKEVFLLFGKGETPKQISNNLFISRKTVTSHRTNSQQKLGVKAHGYLVMAITSCLEAHGRG